MSCCCSIFLLQHQLSGWSLTFWISAGSSGSVAQKPAPVSAFLSGRGGVADLGLALLREPHRHIFVVAAAEKSLRPALYLKRLRTLEVLEVTPGVGYFSTPSWHFLWLSRSRHCWSHNKLTIGLKHRNQILTWPRAPQTLIINLHHAHLFYNPAAVIGFIGRPIRCFHHQSQCSNALN